MAPTVWRYSLQSEHHEGWAVFLLDSYGMLAVASDYGNYVHHWPRGGWGTGDFRVFLLGIDPSYLIGKLGHGRTVLDPAGTERRIRDTVLRARREQYLTKDRAQSEWDRVGASDFADVVSFHDWYLNTSLEDAYELAVYQPEPQLVAFTQRVWPRFLAALREDLGQQQPKEAHA